MNELEKKEHEPTFMTWDHIESVRAGMQVLSSTINYQDGVWKNDKLSCSMIVVGQSWEELELHAVNIKRWLAEIDR